MLTIHDVAASGTIGSKQRKDGVEEGGGMRARIYLVSSRRKLYRVRILL